MIKPTFILILCSYIKIIITGVAIPKANAVVETYSIETAYYGGSAQSGAIFDVVIGEVSDVTIIEVDLHISSQVQENVGKKNEGLLIRTSHLENAKCVPWLFRKNIYRMRSNHITYIIDDVNTAVISAKLQISNI